MRATLERLRRDPGLALLVVAIVAAAVLYAPTLGRGLVNYDDPWLVADNWILRHPTWQSLHDVWFELSGPRRFVLGTEYLPVRDLSVMLDAAVWGDWYPGYHLTNVALYLAALPIWFGVLVGFGLDRKLCGLAILLWAIHPGHAESVAWLSERKGLLAVVLAGVAALGYLRFCAGRARAWLIVGAVASIAAVWSKAPALFALATIGALEVVVRPNRPSLRRCVIGLAVLGTAAIVAFVPVLVVALRTEVVSAHDAAPAGWLAMALGLHGVYLELAAMAVRNAASYAISTDGPRVVDIIIGALGLAVALGVVVAAFSRRRPSAAVCAGAVIWLVGWFPVSRLVLPLRSVLVADRYLMLPTLGTSLVAAAAVLAMSPAWGRRALAIVVCAAASLRTLDAQANWRDTVTLWRSAVESNPRDGDAWAMYAEALVDQHRTDAAFDAIWRGLAHTSSPRLRLREALLVLQAGKRERAVAIMQSAAQAGEVRAIANLALLLLEDGKRDEALTWARRAPALAPTYANGYRVLGKVALAASLPEQARAAFQHAYELAPDCSNRYNLGLALDELHRADEARPYYEACASDPAVGAQARARLGLP